MDGGSVHYAAHAVLKTDGKEAEFLTGQSDVVRGVAALAELEPREVLLTQRDGVLIYNGNGGKQVQFHPRHQRAQRHLPEDGKRRPLQPRYGGS